MELQALDGEVDEKYKKVEKLIAQKTEESADARRKAEMLQNEAKTLLAQANSKLRAVKSISLLCSSLGVLTLLWSLLSPPQQLANGLEPFYVCAAHASLQM